MSMSLNPRFHPSHCCLNQNPARAAGREAAAQWGGGGGGFPKVRGQADRFWSAGVQVTLPMGDLGLAAGADAENLPRSCLLMPQFPH